MNPKGLFLRILLNRAHGMVDNALIKTLPKEEADAVMSFSIAEKDPMPLLNPIVNALPNIHYSWVNAYISKVNPNRRKALLACLDDSQRIGICKLSGEKPPAPVTSPLLKKFYLRHLYPLIEIDAKLPLAYIPQTPFFPLLKLSKVQLVDLIDLLGIYDLAAEMKKIVATKSMKGLYKCLTPKQQQFLRLCMQQKDRTIAPSLHLDKWNGQCKELNTLLHQRGLARLGLAISGEHEDFIWYLSHRLDIGRGRLLQKMAEKNKAPHLAEALAFQVESVKKFLLEEAS